MSFPYARAVLLLGLVSACSSAESTPPTQSPSAHEDAGELPVDDGFVGCPESLAKFELGLQASGDQGRITASVVAASNVPPLRYLNDWTLAFAAGGVPLADVELTKAEPFMPLHGHDGIVKPVLEPLAEPGQVRVRNLNFNMRGVWEVRLTLSSPSVGDDYVVFHICIEE